MGPGIAGIGQQLVHLPELDLEAHSGHQRGHLGRWFKPGFRAVDNPPYRLARNMLLRQSAEAYSETYAAIGATDFRAAARGIKVPVLCIAGDHDLAVPPELVAEMAAMIPNSRYSVISGCGHIPCIEKPAELADAITKFLASL